MNVFEALVGATIIILLLMKILKYIQRISPGGQSSQQ
jgi:hypothetical protein